MNIPQVDMMAVTKTSQVNRRAVLGFVPRIGLPIVDYADVERIDTFYLECQKYRDYYRDPYDKVHQPDLFKNHMGQCGIRVDNSVRQLRQPIRWATIRQPVICPNNYKSDMKLGGEIGDILRGQYATTSCLRYKR